MSIKVGCPGCGRRLVANDEAAGRTVKCPGCDKQVVLPRPDEPPSSPITEPEPWFFGALEWYAKATLFLGTGIFAIGLLLVVLVFLASLFGRTSHANPLPPILAFQADPDDSMMPIGRPRRAETAFASTTLVLILTGVSLFGLFTMLVPSLLILLAVHAARDLRVIRLSMPPTQKNPMVVLKSKWFKVDDNGDMWRHIKDDSIRPDGSSPVLSLRGLIGKSPDPLVRDSLQWDPVHPSPDREVASEQQTR